MDLKAWNERGYWLASLSNGHTIKEPDLYEPKGKLSPWNKLKEFIENREGLHVTNLRYCFRSRIYNLPSKSDKPFRFSSNETSKPRGYNYFTTAFSETSVITGEQNSASARRLEAHFDGFKICLYIDTISGESWVTVENANNNEKTF